MSEDTKNERVEETENLLQEVTDIVEKIEDGDMKEKLGKVLETTKSSLAQNQHNAKKRKEAEEALERFKVEAQEAQQKETVEKDDETKETPVKNESNEELETIKSKVTSLEESETKRDFGYSNELSPKETDYLFATARGLGVTPEEALKRPEVKAALDTIKAEGRTEDATPTPSGSKTLNTTKPFKELKREDRKKAWESKA